MYLFPFEMVDKGTNILIYGAGAAGIDYYNQMRLTNYCNVLALVDQKYVKYQDMDWPVIGPELIVNYAYDYIVISVQASQISMEIRQELVELNIPMEKIVLAIGRKVTTITGFNLQTILKSRQSLLHMLKDYENNQDHWALSYLNPILKQLRGYKDKDIIINYMTSFLDEEICDEYKVTLFRILLAADCFSNKLTRMYMQLLPKLRSPEKQWLFFSEIRERLVSQLQEYGYQEYFQDAKRLISHVACSYYNTDNIQKKSGISEDGIKRVAILFDDLIDSSRSSTSPIIVLIANNMASRTGFKVKIFLNNGFPVVRKVKSRVRVYRELLSAVEVYELKGDTFQERFVNYIEAVKYFAPDVCLDIGAERNLATPVLQKLFPMIHRGVVGYSSLMFFDYVITGNKKLFQMYNCQYPCVKDENQIVEIKRGIIKFPFSSANLNRKDYELSDDDFVIVSAGERLGYELTRDFVAVISEKLRKYQNFKLLLIGSKEQDTCFGQVCPELIKKNQIQFFDWQEDFSAFMGMCDVYLYPPAQGGCGSALMAMQKGLPVVMDSRPSDLLTILPIEEASDGFKAMADKLEKLFLSQNYYLEESKKMQDYSVPVPVSDYVDQMLSYM